MREGRRDCRGRCLSVDLGQKFDWVAWGQDKSRGSQWVGKERISPLLLRCFPPLPLAHGLGAQLHSLGHGCPIEPTWCRAMKGVSLLHSRSFGLFIFFLSIYRNSLYVLGMSPALIICITNSSTLRLPFPLS